MMPAPAQPADAAAIRAALDGPLARALRPFIRPVLHTGSGAGPLAGWSIALKDNIDVAGDTVEVGAPALQGRRAAATATAARRLLDAGATIAGRTRVVELCWGSWGLNEHCGMARNPWDAATERVPGGSSAGSAVAVAARLVRAALGSDTAGSIRMPAALCGITGFKPTWGSTPADGMVALAPGYDSLGPLAVTAQDCAAVYAVLAAAAPAPVLTRGRIALLPPEHWPTPAETAVRQAVLTAARIFAEAGFEVIEIQDAPDLAE
jgi:aspartyl-tRNA(Asn)/glutamyl-tRNA(Gln) amidotransferase subunit A